MIKEEIETLLYSYNGRVKALIDLLNNKDYNNDEKTDQRLKTKLGCYRYFITELKRIIHNHQS